jgi:hypothetical protein
VVGLHVLVGLLCVVAGAIAMLSPKRSGRHPTFGAIYYWGLVAVFVSATACPWFVGPRIITCSFSGCWRSSPHPSGARRGRRSWPGWVRLHITGMGLSYILLLTAFYVDNGKSLPLWKDFPPIAYWLLPAAVGLPLIIQALFRHPLVRH